MEVVIYVTLEKTMYKQAPAGTATGNFGQKRSINILQFNVPRGGMGAYTLYTYNSFSFVLMIAFMMGGDPAQGGHAGLSPPRALEGPLPRALEGPLPRALEGQIPWALEGPLQILKGGRRGVMGLNG